MITLLDRAILNVLAYGPHAVSDISYELWLQTGVDIGENTVRRCLLRMLGLRAVTTVLGPGKAVIWSVLPVTKGRQQCASS